MREFKTFLRKKLTTEQKLRAQILDSENPYATKQKLLKDKLEMLKYLNRQGVSQETLDRISKQYFLLRKISPAP